MDSKKPKGLQYLEASHARPFEQPSKKINNEEDVKFFLTSKAYTDLVTFILQLNASLFPSKSPDSRPVITTWELGSGNVQATEASSKLASLLSALSELIDKSPPDQGPRRFGNVAFRKWYSLVEESIDHLLEEHLPSLNVEQPLGAQQELKAYLLGSFGSAQRLDYGTGHELSFLAFLAALWKLGAFGEKESQGDSNQERAIVLNVFEPYLELVRRLILTYTLEPAGSHGVWGLDDHSFLPYLFGSAQLGPPISDLADIPQEGSLSSAPDPADVVKASVVERQRKINMYFSAIGFIYDVKKGPFWEHSPTLYDISGIRAGWAKVNKGMIKMYIAEVLSKFPVVQHFPFGAVFSWEKDPAAPPPTSTPHTSTAPQGSAPSSSAATARSVPRLSSTTPSAMQATRAPWASATPESDNAATPISATAAPWANASSAANAQVPTRAPWAVKR